MGNKSRFHVDVMSLSEEVTGSCHLNVVKFPNGETVKFIVDCGLFQETKYNKYNDTLPFNPEELSFVLVTHNHTDHIGRIPFLAKLGFRNRIYATEFTKCLMPESLTDSCKILRQVAKRRHTRPLYNDEDLNATLGLIKGYAYNVEIEVHEHVTITFLDNGHLPGAAMILVSISYPDEESIHLLYTGDYSKESTFLNVETIPEYVFDLPLTIIQEATYATTYTEEVESVFEKNLLKAVSENKTSIIPVFSLDRAQKLMLKIRQLQDCGKLDKEIPVHLDGKLSIRYTGIYLQKVHLFKDECKDFLPFNLNFVSKKTRDDVISDPNCKIILTSSGMGSYGPAPLYINNYISSENALIHFVGYPAKNTLSRRLKNAAKGDLVKVGSVVKQKNCEIEYTTEFSSHAKLDEMLDFLKQFNNLKLILVNHGEYVGKEKLAEQAVTLKLAKDVAIESRATFYRIGRYGLIKELPTKFL